MRLRPIGRRKRIRIVEPTQLNCEILCIQYVSGKLFMHSFVMEV